MRGTMLADTKISLPWWLWAILIILIVPLFLGPLGAITNPKLIGGPEAEAITYAAYLYAGRNFAVGLAFLMALWFRNAPMLFILVFVRLAIDIIDLPVFLTYGLVQNIAVAAAIFGFMYVIAIVAMVHLWKRMNDSDPKSGSG